MIMTLQLMLWKKNAILISHTGGLYICPTAVDMVHAS